MFRCASVIRYASNAIIMIGLVAFGVWKVSPSKRYDLSRTYRYKYVNMVRQVPKYKQRTVNSSSGQIQKVILAAYYRGGSTFLGEMMNNNPDVFYMFEPLYLPHTRWVQRMHLEDRHDSMYAYPDGRSRPDTEAAIEEISDVILNILNCDFEEIRPTDLGHLFPHVKSMSMRPFRSCYHAANRLGGVNTLTVRKCLPVLKNSCAKRNIRSVKVIRMSGMVAERILQRDPSVKIVYQTRDVRGMLVSRAGGRAIFSRTKLNRGAEVACHRIRHDMHKYAELAANFSVLTMRYEDLALRMDATLKNLYKFLGADVPPEVTAWVSQNTRAAGKTGDRFGTRRNSSSVPDKWRHRLGKNSISIINKHCRDVLQYQGYALS